MTSSFKERQIRARQWLARESPAESLLLFYLELLEIQEPIGRRAFAAGWADRVHLREDGGAGGGRVQPAFLPTAELLADFKGFITEIAPMATEVLAAIAGELERAGDDTAVELLEAFLGRRDLEHLAGALGCDAIALEFFPRAFLQPVVESAVAALGSEAPAPPSSAEADTERSCPRCGWPPQAAALQDEREVKGRRSLVCSLCGSWWTFPRITCAGCGATDADQLVYHVSDALPYIRIEECRSCRTYLKSIDLRKDGKAVPVVDDLASVELDLWSEEQGLRKIQRNLLGL